jgi:hypothetical protein
MNKRPCRLLIALCVLFIRCLGQNPSILQKIVVDSLTEQLSASTYDTTKIRIRYYLGEQGLVTRQLFWDSLIADAKAHNMTLFEIRALTRLGYIFLRNDKSSKTVYYLKKSVQLAESNGLNREAIMPLNYLTKYYFAENDFRNAFEFCYKGLAIAESLDVKQGVVDLKDMLGSIFLQTGDFKKALKIHFECFKLAKENKFDNGCALALLDIGTDYRWMGDHTNGAKYYIMSAHYIPKNDFEGVTAHIYNALGAAYGIKNMLDSAGYYHLKAKEEFKRIGSKTGETSTNVLLAGNYLDRGDTRNAKKYAMESLEEIKATGYKFQIPRLADLLKKIYIKENNYKEALKWYELSVTSLDSICNEKNREEAMEKQFAYDFEKKESENRLLALQLSQNRYLISGLVILLLLVLVIAFLFVYQYRLKNKQETLNLEQKLLRSQMNPHFIFNSLQAIQGFILKRDQKEVARYLSSFASVTREVLENSRIEVISIKKEVSLLKNYLQLQKLRFDDRFEYQIHVDDKIDTELITVPPMLLQPFIENAIEHGMQDIESGGWIDISYKLENSMLVVEITDNGSGIKSDDSTIKNHRSLAIEITKERVALMNRKGKEKITFAISEAFPEQPVRKGVKVKFTLPVEPSVESEKLTVT